MSKKALTMLVLSCVFVTAAILLTALDAYVSISSYVLLFGSHPENFGEALGTALGGILLYVYTIILGVFVVINGLLTVIFDLVLLLKENQKKWFSFTILGVAALCIVAAIVFIGMLPAISKAQEAAKAASSSSSIESAEALLLLL